MTTPKYRTILDHARPVSPSGGVSLTDQQYKADCDINTILRRFQATGVAPATRPIGAFGDFVDFGDFAACMDKINRATADFAALPSDLRARFGNDPRSFVEFVLNPDNSDECVKLGLRVKPQVAPETAVDVLKRIETKVTSKEGNPS